MSSLNTIHQVILTAAFFVVTNTLAEEYKYGTKTPYTPAGNLQALQSPIDCRPVQLNMVIRHGSRFPSSGSKEQIDSLLKKINKVHSSFKYKNITLPWKLPLIYSFAEGSELSPTGELELYSLAKRFRSRFPSIFQNMYWNRFYKFISTAKERTARSAAAFSYGLFEGIGRLGNASYQPIPILFSGPKDNDKLLRYYDACPRYKKEIEDGSGLDEWKTFGKSPEMKQLIATIEERLKIKDKVSLSAEDVLELFMICAFSTLNKESREWCSLFTNEDINVLNYWIDLENFYSHSYGNPFSYKTSCPLLADITKSILNYANKSMPFGVFRFGHSGTVLALMTLLELYKEPVTLYSSQYRQNGNRVFYMYKMIPMAANIAFVLNKCSGNEYKVQVLMNEKLMSLPCCVRQGQTTCSLKTFKSCFEHKDCDFDGMCKVSSAVFEYGSRWWFILTVFVALNALH